MMLSKKARGGNGRILFGIILLIVGTGYMLKNFIPEFDSNFIWPAILIAIGLFLVLRRKNEKDSKK